jgi:ribosomal protein S18 acetylase RimI-like enzyme
MAARLNPEPASPDLIDLRRVSARELDPLLREETAAWRDDLDWDFDKSADLVRRFVDLHALSGHVLMTRGQPAGYLYYVLEENKGLVGDLFLAEAFRSLENEDLLLGAAIDSILERGQATRIEAQLLMLGHAPARRLPYGEHAEAFDRNFMRVDLRTADLGAGHVRRPMYLETWSDHYHDAAAQLIAEAYTGHVDSRINDQYRSVAGARRFLFNIVQYPGCGAFFRPASYAAFEGGGRLCGISLASLVSPHCGHITQLCVSASVRGTGIGHALLRQSLITLRDMGCHAASLTVTSANEGAVALYERMGYLTIRRFSAYAWEGF